MATVKFTVIIKTDNAAFADDPEEVNRLLDEAVDRLKGGEDYFRLRDVNGNVVGYARQEAINED